MWSRLDGETDEELIYRICSLKGSEGLENWQSIANVLNEITGQEYTESKYRKQYQAFQKMLNGNQRLFVNDDSQLAELEVQKRELAKERQKLSDARVDYNRIIREEARKESYLLGHDDTYLGLAKTYTNEQIAALDSSVAASTGYVLSGITEVDGKLTGYTQTWLDASVITYNGTSHVDTALTDIFSNILHKSRLLFACYILINE